MGIDSGGAAAGAASGAAMGTAVMPGIGTAIGAIAGGLLGGSSKKKTRSASSGPADDKRPDQLSQVDFGDENIVGNVRYPDPGQTFAANLLASLNVAPAQFGGYPVPDYSRPRATTLTGPSAFGGVSSPLLPSGGSDLTTLLLAGGAVAAGGVLLFVFLRR